ncbi:MAG: peptide deformylase [Chloroflexi bacterium]|nr:peptide deformylase [Chloroflexota bacterium]
MTVLPISLFGNPILRQRARRVTRIDGSVQKLIADMVETMRDASGTGLAAPQVGVPLQVLVIEPPEDDVLVLINPQIVRKKGQRVVQEGCLSLPGYRGDITRSETVTAKGRDRHGKEIRVRGEGILAQALEHELDHLRGVLFTDYLESMDKLYKIRPEEAENDESEDQPEAAESRAS